MNEDLAHLTAVTAFRAGAELTGLLEMLKSNLPADEYEAMAKKIARCSAEIGLTILQPIFEEHPIIKARLDERVETYGRVF